MTHIARSSRVYFNQLPLLESGKVPEPWGYWSLERQPTAKVSSNTLTIPGVTLKEGYGRSFLRYFMSVLTDQDATGETQYTPS